MIRLPESLTDPQPDGRFIPVLGWSTVALSLVFLAIAGFQAWMVWWVIPLADVSVEEAFPGLGITLGTLEGIVWVVGAYGGAFLLASAGLLARREWGRIAFIVMSALTAAWNAISLPAFAVAGPLLIEAGLASPGMVWLLVVLTAVTVAIFVWLIFLLTRPRLVRAFQRD